MFVRRRRYVLESLYLRVVWLSGVWSEVHQRYLASKPMPDTQADMVTGTQHEQQAA